MTWLILAIVALGVGVLCLMYRLALAVIDLQDQKDRK